MNDNVLTSYSFLAALSENETDIYKTVYLPLFKRAISSYAAKKSSKVSNSIQGTDIDIPVSYTHLTLPTICSV